MTTIEVFAPAKINLTLHVTGQRADGYHLLDSHVCFADIGDRLTIRKSERTSLSITGPFADGVPIGPENLVLRAATLLGVTADITLEKNLPSAAGIGGGSADAAATLRGLAEIYEVALPKRDQVLSLGADVPVCLMGGQVRMRGIGDDLTSISSERLAWPTILVNPGISVSTPQVFARLAVKSNPPMPDTPLDEIAKDLPDWLKQRRNDLEDPAVEVAPVIADVLKVLHAEHGCRIARMSGSGATCFAIFDDNNQATDAVRSVRAQHPDWWAEVAIN